MSVLADLQRLHAEAPAAPWRYEVTVHGPATIYDPIDVGWIARVKESLPSKEPAAALIVALRNNGDALVELAKAATRLLADVDDALADDPGGLDACIRIGARFQKDHEAAIRAALTRLSTAGDCRGVDPVVTRRPDDG